MRVRVVVYNVQGFRDGPERLVRLVGHFRPDVLLLNETGGSCGGSRRPSPWTSPPTRGRRSDDE